ncbi:MAG: hypothetical protein Q4B70_15590 [Lachnospiraceae bacterium]|nr:hypothetical protein [Lachnospiraceae bacterium]
MTDIYSSLNIKGKTLKNRIVLGPAERVGLTYDNAIMGEDVIQEYETLAENNIGLIIFQSLVVSQKSIDYTGWPMPGAYKRENLEPLKRMVDAAHRNGSVFIVQLGSGYPYSNEWTTEDMDEFLNQYLVGAQLCIDAGVDGIEIHGAHDLTLGQIVDPIKNRRTDKYRNGLDFVKEIVNWIRRHAPEDMILSYRMGCSFDWNADIKTAKSIEELGFDILNVSYGAVRKYPTGIPVGYEYSEMTFAASVLKEHISIPVIAGIGIETIRRGNALVEAGRADLVAYAKPFMADPMFATRSIDNPDYRPCLGCRMCHWGSDGNRCPGRIKSRRE